MRLTLQAVCVTAWLLLMLAPAWAFEMLLTIPSASGLPNPMIYGRAQGEVDSMDDELFHLSISLQDGLKGFLGGRDRFGMTGVWFNSVMPLEPDHITMIPPDAPWIMQLNNPNCPGGCREGDGTRVSGFGEFQHKFIWRGPLDQRPMRFDLDINVNAPIVEHDFAVLSTPKPPHSINIGRFAIYIDGFQLMTDGQQVGGTFIKD